jgi:ribonuclease HII
VVAAAVILPEDGVFLHLRDSKQLTPRQRDRVYQQLLQQAVAYGLGIVSHVQIDRQHILWAAKEAMGQAVQQLTRQPDLLLIDGPEPISSPIPQWTLIQGDARCASIAAASVVAKVTRDRLMLAYAKRYPGYGFETHKGYPTAEHYRRLRLYGPCAIHRRSFRGVDIETPLRDVR